MRWWPAGLPGPVVKMAEAIEGRFALRQPVNPQLLASYPQSADLPSPADWEGAQVFIKDIGGGVSVTAFSDGTDWRRSDTLGAL